MPVTIYFAGAISGGRGDVRHYRAIVESLARAGHHVLAGAVASEEVGEEGEALDPAAICTRDLRWVEEADVLVAEVSTPSTGVGYEIAAARYRYAKPVICLYRPGVTQRCSAMVAGDAGIELITYAETPEMLVRLQAALEKYTTAAAG